MWTALREWMHQIQHPVSHSIHSDDPGKFRGEAWRPWLSPVVCFTELSFRDILPLTTEVPFRFYLIMTNGQYWAYILHECIWSFEKTSAIYDPLLPPLLSFLHFLAGCRERFIKPLMGHCAWQLGWICHGASHAEQACWSKCAALKGNFN